eukprot:g16954.t1
MDRLAVLSCELQDIGLLSAEQAGRVRDKISYKTDRIDAVSQADLVVEAIVEDAAAKSDLYDQLAMEIKPDAVLASNTSFLDIFPLLPAQLRERALIVHWYTPPYLIDLVDLVPGPETPVQIVDRMAMFLKKIGKRPVRLKKFVPGYIANNVQMAIEAEVFRLLDDGVADVADIDDAVRFGLAQRLCLMGQFKKIDYTGLQVVRDIHATGLYQPPSQPTGTSRLDELLEEGASGLLSGKGFYRYGEGSSDDYLAQRDRKFLRLKAALKDDDGAL